MYLLFEYNLIDSKKKKSAFDNSIFNFPSTPVDDEDNLPKKNDPLEVTGRKEGKYTNTRPREIDR